MRRYWTTREVRELGALYPITSNRELGSRLGRAPKAVALMALKLGLRKSPQFMAQHCRFQKGRATWNAGKPWSPDGSRATQFKKGHRGARQKPVGAERHDRDGIMIKVAEPGVWMPKPRLVWEQHFGPIPAGALVRLKDGNPDNCAQKNLQLVTRAELIRLNWKPRGPARRPTCWTAPLLRPASPLRTWMLAK